MPPSKMGMGDSVEAILNRGREVDSDMFIRGHVVVELYGPDGELKQREVGKNLVTDHGDEQAAERVATGDTEDIVTGMRLGTGSTTESKAGAGSFIVTYISGSQEALDVSPPATSDKGAGAGFRVTYICTWIAGDVTNAAIAEVALTDETPITDVQGTAANTVAKFIFASTIDKQAGDSLVVTWNEDFLGA